MIEEGKEKDTEEFLNQHDKEGHPFHDDALFPEAEGSAGHEEDILVPISNTALEVIDEEKQDSWAKIQPPEAEIWEEELRLEEETEQPLVFVTPIE